MNTTPELPGDRDVIYFDKYGLIVQRDGDGGDTAQRQGLMWAGIFIREQVLGLKWHLTPPIKFEASLSLLEPGSSGEFVRHPVQWNDPQDFSRDQSIPIIAAMGLWLQLDPLRRMWDKTKARFFRFQNGDLCFFEHVNLFRRALGEKPQLLGDFQLVGSSAARCALGLAKDDVGDDLNHIVSLLLAKHLKATALVDQAIEVYKNLRPVNYGCFMSLYRNEYGLHFDTPAAVMIKRIKTGIEGGWKPDCPEALGALRWYFRAESGGSSALPELYAPIIDAYLAAQHEAKLPESEMGAWVNPVSSLEPSRYTTRVDDGR